MIVLRVLKFEVTVDHPHRFLLHYLKSLVDWMTCSKEDKLVFSRTCWSMLNDFYTNPKCIEHEPQAVAIAIISLGLKTLDLEIAASDEALLTWNEALKQDVTQEKVN